jgi:hypothetical protein
MKDLILDCFTFACLILPFDPLPQECDGVELRLSVVRVGCAAGILHPRHADWGSYAGTVRYVRQWLQSYPTTPGIEWSEHLPPAELCKQRYDLATDFLNTVGNRKDLTFDELWQARCEGERLQMVWWHLWCGKEGDNWTSRRWHLMKLRHMLGDEAFVRGLWPCPVPLKYVQEWR